jgi:hypothetical protein
VHTKVRSILNRRRVSQPHARHDHSGSPLSAMELHLSSP